MRLVAAVGVLAAVAIGCSDDDSGEDVADSATANDQGAPRVEVAGDGSCIWSGGEVSVGFVDVEFVNNSSEGIAVEFTRLVEGASIDDVIATAPESGDLRDYHELPSFAEPGPLTRTLEPGTTISFAVTLTEPGDYAVSCSMTEPFVGAGVPTIAPVVMRVVS